MKRILNFLLVLVICQSTLYAQGWLPVLAGMNGAVHDFVVFNNELYAAGSFTTANGVGAKRIAKWNGTSWEPILGGAGNPVDAMAVYNGALYIAGGFGQVDGQNIPFIAKWDGTSWSSVGTGTPTNQIFDLETYNGKLYAGGAFINGGLLNKVASWNDTIWEPLTTGLDGIGYDLHVHGGLLYVAGNFSNAGGLPVNKIASWDGTAWDSLESGVDGQVSRMGSLNNELIVSGNFNTAGGVAASRIARWTGSAWGNMGSGLDTIANAFESVGTKLYAGGYFTTAGGVAAQHVAQWDGSNWSSMGSGTDDAVLALEDFEDQLWVGGKFKEAGDSAYEFIARWDECFGFDAAFTIDEDTTTVGFAVQFTDATIGAVDAWLWDFGDDNSSVLQSPSYAYSGNGHHVVKLISTGGLCYDSSLALVVVNWPSGLSEHPSEIEFRLSPNPAVKDIQVVFADAIQDPLEVEVFNELGESVKKFSISQGMKQFHLDVGALLSGFYILRLRSRDRKISSGFIKQ